MKAESLHDDHYWKKIQKTLHFQGNTDLKSLKCH